jgi:hypothetical protein
MRSISPTKGQVGHHSILSCGKRLMVNTLGRIMKACLQIVFHQIWHFIRNLTCGQSRGEQVQYVRYADTHAANARTATALSAIDCDSLVQIRHNSFLLEGAKISLAVDLYQQSLTCLDCRTLRAATAGAQGARHQPVINNCVCSHNTPPSCVRNAHILVLHPVSQEAHFSSSFLPECAHSVRYRLIRFW